MQYRISKWIAATAITASLMFGFITPAEGGKDLFVHHSNVVGEGFKSLAEGASVEFEAAEGQKGPEARNVVQVGS